MINGKTQNEFVLSHLIDHGYITETVARNYGVRRLASRIHDLGKQCVSIGVEFRRDDSGVRYAYYTMASEDRLLERARRATGLGWKLPRVQENASLATAA